jgi:plastocyanin
MSPHPAPRAVSSRLAALLAVVLLVGAAACGDTDEPEATGSSDPASDASDAGTGGTGGTDYGTSTGGAKDDALAGTIVAKDFSLTDITVGPGDEIVLKNEGGADHTATADDGEFDLGEVEPGSTSEPGPAPYEPGSYTFHCEIHPTMTATLTVEG